MAKRKNKRKQAVLVGSLMAAAYLAGIGPAAADPPTDLPDGPGACQQCGPDVNILLPYNDRWGELAEEGIFDKAGVFDKDWIFLKNVIPVPLEDFFDKASQ